MLNNLKITFDFGTGEEDFTTLARTLEVKECVGALGKHETQTAELTVKSKELTVRILSATEDIKGFIYEDEILIFSGIVKSSLSVATYSHIVDPVTISILDNTEKLKCYVYDEEVALDDGIKIQEFTNIATLNSEDPTNSLFHILVDLCSSDFIVESEIEVPNIVVQLKLEEGNYINSYLADLCYEHEIDYRFIGNTIKVFSTKTNRESTKEISSNLLRNNLGISKGDSDVDGLKVSYRKFLSIENYVLATIKKPDATWANSYWVRDGFTTGYDGSWREYPIERDEDGNRYSTNWDFSLIKKQYSSPTVIAIDNYKPSISHHGAYQHVRGQIDTANATTEKGKAWIEYSGWYDELFRNDSITMKVLGTVYLSESRNQSTIITGDNPVSYEAKTISEDDEVKIFATNINNKKKSGKNVFTFLSYEKIEPNSVISFNENKNLNLLSKLRILSRKKDYDTNRFYYELEGIDSITVTKPITTIHKEERYPAVSIDFLKIQSTRYKIESTESLTESLFIITAYGTVFDQYNLVPSWTINDKAISVVNPQGFTLTKDNLNAGTNYIKASVTYNSETVVKVIQVEYNAPVTTNIELLQSSSSTLDDNFIGEYNADSFYFDDIPIEVGQKKTVGKNTILVVDGIEKGVVSETANKSFGIFDIAPVNMVTDSISVADRQYIIEGDSYIYHSIKTTTLTAGDGTVETITEDVYKPCVFSSGSWIECANIADLNYSAVMSQSRDIILSEGKNIKQNSIALYGYFQNLSAVNAVFDNIYTKSIVISDQLLKPGSSTEREDFSVNISAAKYNEEGAMISAPAFELKTGDSYLLAIDNNFYDFYESKTKRALVNGTGDFAITDSRIYMKGMVADGLSAKNCNIYGNGSFDILQTPAFVVQPSGRDFVKIIKSLALNERMAFDLCIWAKTNNISFDTMIRCEVAEESNIGWILFSADNISGLASGSWNTEELKCYVYFYNDTGNQVTMASSTTTKVGVDVANIGWWGVAWPWLGSTVVYHFESAGTLGKFQIYDGAFHSVATSKGTGITPVAPIKSVDPDFLALQTPIDYGITFRDNPVVTYNGSSLNSLVYDVVIPTYNALVGVMAYKGSSYDVMLEAPALDSSMPIGTVYNVGGVLHVK